MPFHPRMVAPFAQAEKPLGLVCGNDCDPPSVVGVRFELENGMPKYVDLVFDGPPGRSRDTSSRSKTLADPAYGLVTGSSVVRAAGCCGSALTTSSRCAQSIPAKSKRR